MSQEATKDTKDTTKNVFFKVYCVPPHSFQCVMP